MRKRKHIFTLSILFIFLLTTSVFAKTETIEINKAESINLIQLAKQLHETYEQNDTTYYFSFNGNTFEITKNSPLIKINEKLEPIETETINQIILPKYTTLKIDENQVEMNYEKFLKLTNYKTNEKGIELNLEDDYEKPKATTIENLDFNYLNENLYDLGYVFQDNLFKYYINDLNYQEISINTNSITIRTYLGEEYEPNKAISNLLIEELLKSLDKEAYREIYNAYLNGENTEKTTDKFKITILFSDTYSLITIQTI